jgi:hypothetical protein
MSLAPDALGMLRVRLVALRDDLRGRIAAAETIERAWLAMLADVETVLAALDRDDATIGLANA